MENKNRKRLRFTDKLLEVQRNNMEVGTNTGMRRKKTIDQENGTKSFDVRSQVSL